MTLGLRVGVVGASIGGLSAACALGRSGARVHVLERARPCFAERGGGLGVNPELVTRVSGRPGLPCLVLRKRRLWSAREQSVRDCRLPVASYGALWRWLWQAADRAAVEFQRDVALAEHRDCVRVTTSDGRVSSFELLVAADGGGSAIRSTHFGARRAYAGYTLWRGLVPLRALPALVDREPTLHVATRPSQHFVAYPIPGPNGSLEPEDRRLNWGWYRGMPEAELSSVLATLSGSPHVLTRHEPSVRALSKRWTPEGWPGWVDAIVRATVEHGQIRPHPVYQYVPASLGRRRIALLGDAGHLASPITGAGAGLAMEDALELAAALGRGTTVEAAVADYSSARLERTQQMVRRGVERGSAFR
ncbi:MAG: FAD-dependent monooxygenase [Myxococcota bacterium]